MNLNRFEEQAREKKAQNMVNILHLAAKLVNPQFEWMKLADLAESFRDEEWGALDLLSQNKRPASSDTRTLVKAKLRKMAEDEANMYARDKYREAQDKINAREDEQNAADIAAKRGWELDR